MISSGHIVDIENFINLIDHIPVIDVRSESEFEKGHIPGAVNIPVLNNSARKEIGIIYATSSSQQAVLKGLETASPNIKNWVGEAIHLAKNKEIAVYCARGGMRSTAMSWLFSLSGLKVYMLKGGYKAYRNFVLSYFCNPFNLIVVGGYTGSGKTLILLELKKYGSNVIDIENLACHKGSVLGALGQPPQPSTQLFENRLFNILMAMDKNKPIWIEDESYAVGRVNIPFPFYNQMQKSRFVFIDKPIEERMKFLLDEYGHFPVDDLKMCILKLTPYAGSQAVNKILNAIEMNDLLLATSLLLHYYDKVYKKSLNKHTAEKMIHIDCKMMNYKQIAELLIKYEN